VQSSSYTYNLLGNPLSRTDDTSNLSESFTYDPLNRLLTATVSTGVAPAKAYAYNSIGNMMSKSDAGTYTYAPPGSPLPHAVMSISGSTLSTTFAYDPVGNQTSGLGRNITWTSYNMPASITQGTNTVSFQHDVDHQRIKQITAAGTTRYINAFGVTAELFAAGSGAARWNDYLSVGNARVGMRVTDLGTLAVSMRYFHTDHLGSVAVITNESAVVLERLSYDAWGKRRFANGADDPTGSITSQTSRGFTGHEELDAVALVHMNGRIYDPLVGRLISADPTVPDPMNAQAWNRYSYVGNDPLAFTDPSGFSWLSSFFHSVANFLTNNPIVKAILQIAITVTLTAALGPEGFLTSLGLTAAGATMVAAAAGAAIVTGLSGGNLGQMLKAGAIAAATAIAFYEVGDATNALANYNPVGDMPAHIQPAFGTGVYAFNVAGHAAVGCLAAAASGGSCKSGALSGAAGAAAAPLMGGLNGGQRLVASSLIGGVASVAGGGKFANGAITGAFGYMFNACGADLNGCFKLGLAAGTTSGLYSAGIVGGGSLGLLALPALAIAGLDILIGGGVGAIADIIGNSANAWIGNVLNSDSGPNETPTGTRPIDKWGIPRGDIHDIKDGLGAGPEDWVGVTPGGQVITTGPNGESVNNGHVDDYTNRPLKQFPRGD
jgi:RHS repeat-associated protein